MFRCINSNPLSEATILQHWERDKGPSPEKHKMDVGGDSSSLMVIDRSPCARHEPKNADKKKPKNAPASTQTRKKKREEIKSPALSLERQFLILNIYMNCLSCVDNSLSWGTSRETGRVTPADSTASFEIVSSSSLLPWFRWQLVHSMDKKKYVKSPAARSPWSCRQSNSCYPRCLPWPLPFWCCYCLLLQPESCGILDLQIRHCCILLWLMKYWFLHLSSYSVLCKRKIYILLGSERATDSGRWSAIQTQTGGLVILEHMKCWKAIKGRTEKKEKVKIHSNTKKSTIKV